MPVHDDFEVNEQFLLDLEEIMRDEADVIFKPTSYNWLANARHGTLGVGADGNLWAYIDKRKGEVGGIWDMPGSYVHPTAYKYDKFYGMWGQYAVVYKRYGE